MRLHPARGEVGFRGPGADQQASAIDRGCGERTDGEFAVVERAESGARDDDHRGAEGAGDVDEGESIGAESDEHSPAPSTRVRSWAASSVRTASTTSFRLSMGSPLRWAAVSGASGSG